MNFIQPAMDKNNSKYSMDENDGSPLRILSSEILQENERIIIEHNGEEYVLRITRNGKLILTK